MNLKSHLFRRSRTGSAISSYIDRLSTIVESNHHFNGLENILYFRKTWHQSRSNLPPLNVISKWKSLNPEENFSDRERVFYLILEILIAENKVDKKKIQPYPIGDEGIFILEIIRDIAYEKCLPDIEIFRNDPDILRSQERLDAISWQSRDFYQSGISNFPLYLPVDTLKRLDQFENYLSSYLPDIVNRRTRQETKALSWMLFIQGFRFATIKSIDKKNADQVTPYFIWCLTGALHRDLDLCNPESQRDVKDILLGFSLVNTEIYLRAEKGTSSWEELSHRTKRYINDIYHIYVNDRKTILLVQNFLIKRPSFFDRQIGVDSTKIMKACNALANSLT